MGRHCHCLVNCRHGVVIFDIKATKHRPPHRNNVIEQLRKAVEKGKLDAAACAIAEQNIVTGSSIDGMSTADIVIEAIAERPLTSTHLHRARTRVTSDAILTSNTSSISIASLASLFGKHIIGLPDSTSSTLLTS
ncbi:MAG: hypothetical protein IPP80_13855 [Ignavibacteria bacterium]|nr:hypothetical protein [Ignavibacteria bacterium]